MPKAILILAAALLSLASLGAGAETLTATWEPRVLHPGDQVTMRGPDGGTIEMVVEVPPLSLDDASGLVARTSLLFRLTEPYGGYRGLTLPAGTRALGTTAGNGPKTGASREKGPMDLIRDAIRQIIHPTHHTVEVTFASLCTPDGTCLLSDGPRDERQTSP